MDRNAPNPFDDAQPPLQTPSRDDALPEPKSEYLRQKLRERRESVGLTDQPMRSLSLSGPKPAPALDDYIFESEDDDKINRRKNRAQGNRGASSQYVGGNPARQQSYSMGSRDVQANMDKMSKENFDLKLRLCLVEERSHKLDEELAESLEKLDAFNKLEEERDDLEEENQTLRSQVDELQRSNEGCEQKLRDSWKMNGEIFAELEKRDAAIKEALDMYLDSERKTQALEQELAKCKAAPYRRDSSYFSNEPDAASIARSLDELSRPSTSSASVRRGGYESGPSSPEQRDTLHTLSSPQPRDSRYTRLARTVSVGETRLCELRRRASTASTAEFEDHQPNNLMLTPERPKRALRRLSESPQTDRASIKTSSSNHSRGLRSVYLDGEQAETATRPEAMRAVSSPETLRGSNLLSSFHNLSVSPRSTVDERSKAGSRATATSSSWETCHAGDYEPDTESIAESDLPEGSVEGGEADVEVRSEGMQLDDGELATPTVSEVPTIPTEYRPGQYPKWPGTGGRFGFGRDMFFNGDGLDEIPRGRR